MNVPPIIMFLLRQTEQISSANCNLRNEKTQRKIKRNTILFCFLYFVSFNFFHILLLGPRKV